MWYTGCMEKNLTPAAIAAFVAEMQDFSLIATRAHAEKEFKNALRREKRNMKIDGTGPYLRADLIAAQIRRAVALTPERRAFLATLPRKTQLQQLMSARARLIEARLWEREAAKRGQA